MDGYVLPLPQDNLAAYRRRARKAGKVWIEQGALACTGFVADPRLQSMTDARALPFDGRRMVCGGFKGLVEP